jgi:hypothetical protein
MDQADFLKKEKPATVDKFLAFDKAHPDVWKRFCEISIDLLKKGHVRYSSDGILHVIRWHYHTTTSGKAPKINNNYSSFYSRKWEMD